MTAVITLLLQRWRWAAGAVALAAAICGGAWLAHRLDASGRERAEARAEAAEAQVRAAQAQVQLDAASAAILDTAHAAESRAARRTGDADHAIAQLPHAQDPLDHDVLAEWAAAVDGLRHEAAAARAPARPTGGDEPARAVPPT